MDINKLKREAIEEFEKEQSVELKKLYKEKLKELEAAKKIVKNIQTEITDIEMSGFDAIPEKDED